MAIRLTEDQQNAVNARCGSVLVSAAAGSGKTAVLCRRAVSLLADGDSPIPADRLLVVTFTNAAAEEMRERIYTLLGERIAAEPQNGFLARQQLLLSSASVCTIDSFCVNLLRENFYAANIPSDFKIADGGTMQILRAAALDAALSELHEVSGGEIRALAALLGDRFGDSSLASAILKIDDYLGSLCFPEEWTNRAVELYRSGRGGKIWRRAVMEHYERRLRGAADVLETLAGKVERDDGLSEKWRPYLRMAVSAADEICGALRAQDHDRAAKLLSGFSLPRAPIVKKIDDIRLKDAMSGAVKQLKALVGEAQPCFDRTAEEDDAELAAISGQVEFLFRCVELFRQKLSDLKNERGVLDFADVEATVLRLLIKRENGRSVPTDLAREQCARYDEILVDEYQDTNNLQDAIFTAISDNGRKLFMVGDAKQSIYGFRKANPENYMRRRAEYPMYDGGKHPSTVLLGGNFRSRKGVTDAVNFIFSLAMSRTVGDIDYDSGERLVSMAEFPENGRECASLHVIESGELSSDEAEGRYAAALIERMVDEGYPLRDGASGGLRGARYGDFCILLRAAGGHAAVYAEELRRRGIPVRVEQKGEFLSRPEIQQALSLLRAIDNPLLDVPLLSALMSPVFGFSAERIAQIRLPARNMPLYSTLLQSAERGECDSRDAVERLTRWREDSRAVTAAELIGRIYVESGLTALALGYDGGEARRENLLALQSCAENAESPDLSAFVRYIDKLQAASGDLPVDTSFGGGDDAVRIMTVHRSKGLQAPICIVAGTARRFRANDSDCVVMSEDMGIGLRINADGRQYYTSAADAVRIEGQARSVSEEMRLLYVALTRAEERVIMLAAFKNAEKRVTEYGLRLQSSNSARNDSLDISVTADADCCADWIIPCVMLSRDGVELRAMGNADLNTVEHDARFDVHIVRELPSVPERETETRAVGDADGELLEQIRARLEYVYPFGAANTVPAKNSASALAELFDGEDLSFTETPDFMKDGGISPTQRGSALHKFMQLCDFGAAAQNPETELRRLVSEGKLNETEGAAVDMGRVRAFFESELYRRIAASPTVLREQSFALPLPANLVYGGDEAYMKDERVVIQGAADCVFFEDGRPVVVDYKTDRDPDMERLARRYRRQLEIYALVFGQIYNAEPKPCELYSFYNSCSVTL